MTLRLAKMARVSLLKLPFKFTPSILKSVSTFCDILFNILAPELFF